ncbi:hypothetical protein [Rhizobium sp. G21]|uniref:hypothetical protein n=1 Tax=Rhizobium sp. G21 TaxID=2758439 RepID=UPI0016030341|nr:hypothetical protein [Rhizobium sp. G21]MBB1249407.1 hypothetical protein [Rhizobium sp. G21]
MIEEDLHESVIGMRNRRAEARGEARSEQDEEGRQTHGQIRSRSDFQKLCGERVNGRLTDGGGSQQKQPGPIHTAMRNYAGNDRS